MTKNKLERRFLQTKELRVTSSDGAPSKLEGYAAVFNSDSYDLGGFVERIAPGAFAANLNANPDVRALINHDPNLVLGRTKSGTLRLNEDETGLHFECDLPATTVARDLATSIARQDIDQCSFGMYVEVEEWAETPTGYLRTIKSASLFDVSAVTYPAYEASSCSVRSLFPDGVPAEVRSHLLPANLADVPVVDRTEEKSKEVAGELLLWDDFLVASDRNDPATWQLPVRFRDAQTTKAYIRDAVSTFGQVEGLSDADKTAAWDQLVTIAKKHEIDVGDEGARSLGQAAESALLRARIAQSL